MLNLLDSNIVEVQQYAAYALNGLSNDEVILCLIIAIKNFTFVSVSGFSVLFVLLHRIMLWILSRPEDFKNLKAETTLTK